MFEKLGFSFVDDIFDLLDREVKFLGKGLEAYAIEKPPLEDPTVALIEDPLVYKQLPL